MNCSVNYKCFLKKVSSSQSRSPYRAPVFFIKKSDGSFSLVCDWRELNKITVKNEACLRNIDDIFDTIQGSKYFTKLDLRSGYNQVRVRDEDVAKTTMNTPLGHYEFKVMGFGLCNALATFQSLMNDVLRPYVRKFVVVFLEDILIFSQNWKEHFKHVRLVLETLKHQLYCKPSKCLVGATETLYLGHCITGITIAPDRKKLEAVENWPEPRNVSQVRNFLGFANYFRILVCQYAELAKPLDQITGRHRVFSWNEERQQAFEDIKSALITAPVLHLSDVSKPFGIHTDASDMALGAVLLQEYDDNWQTVAYASRKLTPAEKNYTIMERETLAVVFARKTWRLYLFNPLWGHCQEYKIEKKQSYKSVFYQKKEALLLITTLPCLKVFVSLITKNKSKSLWHTEKFAKSRLKEKSSGRMRTKRRNRKECSFLRCISRSPGHWQTSKIPQEGRVLSDRKIDLQTPLSSRSQLESSAGKPFTSSSANQTPRQELRTTPLQAARMEESATSEGQNDNFFYRTKVFSKRQHDCLLFSCMHAKNGDAGVTITTKI